MRRLRSAHAEGFLQTAEGTVSKRPPLCDFDGVDARDLARLEAHGVVESWVGEFGDVEYAVKLAHVYVRGCLRFTGITLCQELPCSEKPALQCSKLEVIQQLLRAGWVSRAELGGAAYSHGEPMQVLLPQDLQVCVAPDEGVGDPGTHEHGRPGATLAGPEALNGHIG